MSSLKRHNSISLEFYFILIERNKKNVCHKTTPNATLALLILAVNRTYFLQ